MSVYNQLLQFLIAGISMGSIYAIVGLGFMIVYSVTRVGMGRRILLCIVSARVSGISCLQEILPLMAWVGVETSRMFH